MGVPAFFRWLSRKYPSIVVHCKEEKSVTIDGVKVPIDITKPNPNNVEFDNLYLDMNGIIHPCCHPENKPAPKNEDEMMVDIFDYIDRLMAIIRPRRLLYMAIDGVAPRAKMNQQRSRRFRASKEAKEKRDTILRLKDEMRAKGMIVPDDKPDEDHFDSNCITPGTEFMFKLADCLRFYIHMRQNNDPGWKNLIVILSDANVPGEGEHKIMDYIRRQRAQPDHDANTHHCLCGADADLIMLGLATHEPNFTIIREEFKPTTERPCDICGQMGHLMTECIGASKTKRGEFDELSKSFGIEQEFIFIRLNILREYLYKELLMPNLPFAQDLERAIDDWVMMCFFVGNDFLPHLPSLEIREGAIDRLIGLYKKVIFKTGEYLTDSGHVHLDRVQLVLTDLGEMEDEIFKNRKEQDEEQKRRTEQRKKRERQSEDNWSAPRWMTTGQYTPRAINSSSVIVNPKQTITDMRCDARNFNTLANQDAAAQLRNMLNSSNPEGRKRKMDESIESVMAENEEPIDNIRLWEDGWKERYYENKFGINLDEYDFRYKVANEYVLGICWVLKYYYQGCASWNWYFPYHYAPFASDFVGIGKLSIDFEMDTKPFQPLEQLMSVFPAASKQFLPASWQELMESSDSPIIDFYPIDFCVDLNGKRYAWQGVALLPFVDEKRLLRVLTLVYDDLTDYEKVRNSRGCDRLFVHKDHPLYEFLEALYENSISSDNSVLINTSKTLGVAGSAWCDDKYVPKGEKVLSPLPNLSSLSCNQVMCVSYKDPQYAQGFIFPAKLLPGAKIPAPILKPHEGHISSFRAQTGFTRDSGFSRQNNVSTVARHIRASIPPPQSLYGRGNDQPFNRPSVLPLMANPYQRPTWQNQRPPFNYPNNGRLEQQRYNVSPYYNSGRFNQRPSNVRHNSNMPRSLQPRWRY